MQHILAAAFKAVLFADDPAGTVRRILIHDKLIDPIGAYSSALRIFNTCYAAVHIRDNAAIFKRQITINHFAVLKHKVLSIAKRLCAYYTATDEFQIFRIPAEIFSLYGTVIYRYIFTVPERILRIKEGISYFRIFLHIGMNISPASSNYLHADLSSA